MQFDAYGVDCEATGLSPFEDDVLAVQVGRPDFGYIFDTRTVNLAPIQPFFEDPSIKKVGHYLKYDYKMMKAKLGIELEGIRCTHVAEKVLHAGRKWRGFGLDAVLLDTLNVSLDKTLQKSFIGHKGPFSPGQIQYMEDDVLHMIPLFQAKTEQMIRDGVASTFLLETNCVSSFGDMELSGMILDVNAWAKVLKDNIARRTEVKREMDEMAKDFVGVNLFGEAAINYDSPDQVLKLLQMMRVRVPIMDREGTVTYQIVTSTGKNALKGVRNIKFVSLLEEYRGLSVRINTFGQSYIDAVNPKTGAIHPNLDQLGAETGRPTSDKESDINPLNVPSDNKYRHCFIGGPNEVVESDDYSGCESRILAHISGDKILTQIFLDDKDIHCEVASMLYEIPVAKDEAYAKKFGMVWDPVNKKYRKPAKSLNFGISYGMGPMKLCVDLNGEGFPIEFADSKKLYYKYCDTLETAVKFLRNSGKQAFEDGYLTNINGRRRYWIKPDPSDTVKYPGGFRDKAYQGKKSAIEREGGNFLIQSVNADITKLAMTEIRKYAKKHKVRTSFINAIYDEVVTRTHKDDSPSFHEAKLKIMRDCAEKYITSVPMLVDGFVGPYWNK